MNKRDASQITEDNFQRSMILDRSVMDEEKRTVSAALSSETPVKRYFGNEILVHEKSSIDFSRAKDGLPLLFNHNHSELLGVVRDVRLEKGVLRGTLHFSKNKKAERAWQDVKEGFLKDISIGYRVDKWEESADDDEVRVVNWTLFEASVVTVPADPSVGVNRSQIEDKVMPKKDERSAGNDNGTDLNDENKVVDFKQARRKALVEGREEGRRIESERRDGIEALFVPERFRGGSYDALRAEAIEAGWSVDETRDELLDMVGGGATPTGSPKRQTDTVQSRGNGHIQSGEDQIDKFVRGAGDSLAARTMIEKDDEKRKAARSNEFFSMSMPEMARHYLSIAGVNLNGLGRDAIVSRALSQRGIISHGTSDFAGLLENNASKALMLGYEEAPETWDKIARIGNLSDFKQASRTGLSEFSDLLEVNENGEFKHGDFGDRKENIQLATFGRLFSISRQAIVNDDLDALSAIPRKMGRAAKRKIGDAVYAVLINNAALNQDNKALFHADHKNIVTASAMSIASVDKMRVAMAKQKDSSEAANGLNIPLDMLIVPKSLETTANILRSSQYDPDATGNTRSPNPFHNTFEVVSDVRLDADSATKWYGAANPNLFDTIEVAFLDGNQEPFLESKDGWSVDGVEFKARIDCAAAAMDFRGLQRNAGA